MSSLLKLVETRANKPRMNLLHYVAQLAEERNSDLMSFPDELTHLEDASKFSVDQLLSDVKSLQEKVDNVAEQVESVTDSYKEHMQLFLKAAKEDLEEINSMLEYAEKLKGELAEYFCEDTSTFKLEECIVTFKVFCEKFKKAITENETRVVQEKRAKQRQKQREEQKAATLKRKESIKKSPARSVSAPAGKESNSIVDRLLGNIRDGFTGKYQGVDTDGTTTDSDYGSRPTSPAPNADGKVSTEDVSPASFTRATVARRSFQKTPNLNAISENSSQSRDDIDSGSKRLSGAPIHQSKSDDPLVNLLMAGNEDEALSQIPAFKREGSVRRSGRKRRTSQYNMTGNRERSESPGSFVQEQEAMTKPQKPTETKTIEDSKPETSEEYIVSKSPQKRSYRSRTSLDSPETLLAVNSLARREKLKDFINDDNKVTSPTEPRDQTMYRNVKQNEVTRPVSFGSDDGSISSEVADALSDRTDSTAVCDDIHRERIALYGNLNNTSLNSSDSDKRLSGDSGTFQPISDDGTDSKRNSRADSETSEPHDQLNLGTMANKIEALTLNLDTLEKHKTTESDIREKSVTSNDADVTSSDSKSEGGRLSNWNDNVQSMNIEAAVSTVESSVYDRSPSKDGDASSKKDQIQPVERRESAYRQRLREWKAMRSDSVTQEQTVNPKKLTEQRQNGTSYEDVKASETFMDTPLTPHLAMVAMETESVEERYRDKINRDRSLLESILTGQSTPDTKPKELSPAPTAETTPVLARPVGLKALKLKRLSSEVTNGSDSDDDPWSSIDRQQMEIRRDIFDIKVEQHRRSQSDISTPSSPVKEYKEFISSSDSSNNVFNDDDLIVEDLETRQDINQNVTKSSDLSDEIISASEDGEMGETVIPITGTDIYVLKNNGSETTVPDFTSPEKEVPQIISTGLEKGSKDKVSKNVTKATAISNKKVTSSKTSPVERKAVGIANGKTTGVKKNLPSPSSNRAAATNSSSLKSSSLSRTGSIRSSGSTKSLSPSPRITTSSRSPTPSSRNGATTTTKRSPMSVSPRLPIGSKVNGVGKAGSSRASSYDSLHSVGSERCDSAASGTSSVSSVVQSRKPTNSSRTASTVTRGAGSTAKSPVSRSTSNSSTGTKSNGSPRAVPGSTRRNTTTKPTANGSPQPSKTFVRGAPERTTIAGSALRSSKPSLSVASSVRSSLRGTSATEKLSATSTKSSTLSTSSSARSPTKDAATTNSSFSRAGSVRRPNGSIKTPTKKAYNSAYATLSVKKSPTESSKKTPSSRTVGSIRKSESPQSKGKTLKSMSTKSGASPTTGSMTKTTPEPEEVLEVEPETQKSLAQSAVEALNARLASKNNMESDDTTEQAMEASAKPEALFQEVIGQSENHSVLPRSSSNPDILRNAESTPDVTLRDKTSRSTFQRNGPNRYSLPPTSKNISPSPTGKKSGKPGKFSRMMNRLSIGGSKKSDKLDTMILETAGASDDVFTASSSTSRSKKTSSSNLSKDRFSRNKSASVRVSSKTSKTATPPTSVSKDLESGKRRLWRSSSVKSKEKPVTKSSRR